MAHHFFALLLELLLHAAARLNAVLVESLYQILGLLGIKSGLDSHWLDFLLVRLGRLFTLV